MKKSILVTGGAGFIGSHLCERLVDDGHTVYSIDDYSMGSKSNHVYGVTYFEGSTKDIERIITSHIDLVYHLGEYSRVEQSFENIETVLDSNLVGTKAVLEYVRKQGPKLVYAGSSTKFADGGYGKDQSPYAWTKSNNTSLVQRYGDWFGIHYAITYFYNVYGPNERSDTSSGTLIGIFTDLHKSNKALTVRLPGSQKRNFTHVSDIVDGLILVGEKGDGDEYGLGHTDSYSVLEVAKMFGGEIIELPEREGNRMNSVVDVRRAYLELGWKPKHNLPDYINYVKNEK